MKTNYSNIVSTHWDSVENLNLFFIVVAALIFCLVAFFIFYYIKKYSSKRNPDTPEQDEGNGRIEIIVGVLATALVAFFLYMTLDVMQEIQTIPDNPQPDIFVTGHQWWWEAEYPKTGVMTANEIHIPAGKKILLGMTSADVIHSWWVPDLGRKIDMMPGMTSYIWLYNEKPGVYIGACSEFCGVQHARMRIRVIVDTEEDFKAWSETQLKPVVTTGSADFEKGKELFQEKTCVSCHAINGTDYNETIGPNLTHFGSRKRFLADMKENNETNLRAWLHNPQDVKVGVKMPNFIFSQAEEDALVEYLKNLK